MTTTEQRQIPPPSHFSVSLNRSSAHGENFCQTSVLAVHLGMWSCVSKSTQRECRSTSPTAHTHSHQTQHILSGASLTPSFDLYLPPNCTRLTSSIPPPKHADLTSLTSGLVNVCSNLIIRGELGGVCTENNSTVWELTVCALRMKNEKSRKRGESVRENRIRDERKKSKDRRRKRRKEEREL